MAEPHPPGDSSAAAPGTGDGRDAHGSQPSPSASASGSGPRHDPYAAFGNANFRAYLTGIVLSGIGLRIQGVAIGWEMYQRTGEALALGLVGLVQALPVMILSLPAGYLADRYERRILMVVSTLGTALSSLGLAFISATQAPVWTVYAVLVGGTVIGVLGRPARSAFLPQIIPRGLFPSAITWNSSLNQMLSVVGPAIGGFVLAASLPAAYVCGAIGSLVFVALLFRIHPTEAERDARPQREPSGQMMAAGLRYLWRTRAVLVITALDMFAVLLGGAVYLLPIYAEDILRVGPHGFGWLRAAPAAGALVMALVLAHRPPMRHAGRNLLLTVAGFGLATIVFGLSTSFYLSLGMLFLTGLFDQVSMVIRGTLVQLLTPDRMRGRISAINGMFISASNELGGMESGTVAHWFGPVFSVVSGGIGTLVVVAVTALGSPRVRQLGSLGEVQALEEDEEKGTPTSGC
ncbi:MAG: MFS transporter [Gemmatimonadota bacterium]